MKRNWMLALALAIAAPISLVGCGETEKEKVTIEKSGPGGKVTQTTETKTNVTGDAGAAPAAPK